MVNNPSYFEYSFRYPQLEVGEKEALLRESMQRDPRFAPSYIDLAWLYAEEKKNLPEALGLAERALTLDPYNYAFWDTKAEVLYLLGEIEQAIEIEKTLLEKHPDNRHLKQQLNKFRQALEQSEDG